MEEDSSKRTRLCKVVVSGSITPLLRLLAILHVQIPLTLQEVVVLMFEEDLTYLQNFPEADKIKPFSKATF